MVMMTVVMNMNVMMVKLICAGSRKWIDEQTVYEVLDEIRKRKDILIVSGLAKGPDMFGLEWAKKNGVAYEEFPAYWEAFGKAAGSIRNKEMGDFADELIAFWDGSSRGTKHMIEYMEQLKKPVRIVYPKPLIEL
jgi:YspA, cpYpsA-related SLOG family